MSIKQNISPYLEKIHPLVWQFICLFISLVFFTLILINRAPFLVRPISIALRTGFGVVIPLAALALWAILRIPGRLGDLSGWTAVMSLFALGLAGLWASGNTQSVVLSGLLPLTDAVGYYTDSIRLLHGLDVSNFTAMRPFFAGLLSFFLLISERNLMTAVGIFTALTGIAACLAGREIQRTHGAEAAAFFITLVFLYYRHHSGTTMSESLGVPVSLLGVALIWRSISTQKEWLALFGISMISLALNIRPGAMFVLPALLLWGGWIFRGQGNFSYKFFGLGAVLILLTFYANGRMVDFTSGSKGVPFENFSWAFYGLASGGKPWHYVFEAHPELQQFNDSEIVPAIYRLAFEQLRTDPSLIIKGSFFYWGMFFSNTWYNAYAFVAGDNYWVNEVARWGMYLLCGLGIFKWYSDRKGPYASLAVITALGVLASVPFVPPTDAYRVRLYAATIPFFILLPGMGLSLILDKIPLNLFKRKPFISPEGNPAVSLSFALIAVILTAPVLIKTNGRLPTPPGTSCPSGMDSFFTRFDAGTSINIHRENSIFIDRVPDFHISVFRRNTHDLPDISLATVLGSTTPESTIFDGLDLQINQQAFVVIETDMLPEPGSLIRLCGEQSYDPAVTPYVFFYAEQVDVIRER